MQKKYSNKLSQEFQISRGMDKFVLGGLAITAAIALIIVSVAIWCIGL